MKKTITFIILILFAWDGFSQKNILKGRAFGIPEVNLFSLGLGYERMLDEKLSAQILFNRMGYDMRDTDGGAEFINFIVPEVRFYLGKKENKKAFVGVFTELSKSKDLSNGYFDDVSNVKQYKEGSTNEVAPGVLIGINNGTKKKWLFEVYVGGKYKFATETKEYFLNNETIFEKEKKKRIGIRSGINIGYRF